MCMVYNTRPGAEARPNSFPRYNDNDKRLGLAAKADQPDHKKYNTPKIKMDNEAVQKIQTS